MSATSAIFSAIRRFRPLRDILQARLAKDPNEIIRTIATVVEERKVDPVLRALENSCTPLEFADALARAGALARVSRKALSRVAVAKRLREEAPETYQRLAVANDIALYRDPAVPVSGKCLLLLFPGRARVGIPLVSFVQFVPASRFDIVFLRDRSLLSFEAGIAGFARTLPELVARLGRDLDVTSYRRTATLGASLGGLPALRAGILLGSERAIAMGGRFNWHVGRLLKGGRTIPAFDLLCDCGPRGRTRLIAAYATGHEQDRQDVARLELTHRIERKPIENADVHNITHFLVREGRYRAFLSEILDG